MRRFIRIEVAMKFLVVLALLPNAPAKASEGFAPWIGTYTCEDCGLVGSSTANGKGPAACWEYAVKILKPEANLGQGKAEIQINGFQTSNEFGSQVIIEGDSLDLIVLPKEGLPLVHLFKIRKRAKPSLLFMGVQSNTKNSEIPCTKK